MSFRALGSSFGALGQVGGGGGGGGGLSLADEAVAVGGAVNELSLVADGDGLYLLEGIVKSYSGLLNVDIDFNGSSHTGHALKTSFISGATPNPTNADAPLASLSATYDVASVRAWLCAHSSHVFWESAMSIRSNSTGAPQSRLLTGYRVNVGSLESIELTTPNGAFDGSRTEFRLWKVSA